MGVAIVMEQVVTETNLIRHASVVKAVSFTEKVVIMAGHE